MRLFEGLINSEVSLDQQVQLTREEDQNSILMIGGIGIFLPLNPGEEKFCVVDDAAEERQPTETVREKELEQVLETAQAEEKKMSILRSVSMLSARKLRKLQH
jgi:hypothetical protein